MLNRVAAPSGVGIRVNLGYSRNNWMVGEVGMPFANCACTGDAERETTGTGRVSLS